MALVRRRKTGCAFTCGPRSPQPLTNSADRSRGVHLPRKSYVTVLCLGPLADLCGLRATERSSRITFYIGNFTKAGAARSRWIGPLRLLFYSSLSRCLWNGERLPNYFTSRGSRAAVQQFGGLLYFHITSRRCLASSALSFLSWPCLERSLWSSRFRSRLLAASPYLSVGSGSGTNFIFLERSTSSLMQYDTSLPHSTLHSAVSSSGTSPALPLAKAPKRRDGDVQISSQDVKSQLSRHHAREQRVSNGLGTTAGHGLALLMSRKLAQRLSAGLALTCLAPFGGSSRSRRP